MACRCARIQIGFLARAVAVLAGSRRAWLALHSTRRHGYVPRSSAAPDRNDTGAIIRDTHEISGLGGGPGSASCPVDRQDIGDGTGVRRPDLETMSLVETSRVAGDACLQVNARGARVRGMFEKTQEQDAAEPLAPRPGQQVDVQMCGISP